MQLRSLAFIPFIPVRCPSILSSSKICIERKRGSERIRSCVAHSLEEAIDREFVKDFGRTISLDSDGCFPPKNDIRVDEVLREPLEDVVSIICDALGKENVRAIFLRGSVATGKFIKHGRSDLDLIVLARIAVSRTKKLRVNAALSSVISDVLQLSGADILYIHQRSRWFSTTDLDIPSNIRILLRNYAVLLYGAVPGPNILCTRDKPTGDTALNIRYYERTFLRLFHKGTAANDFRTQKHALQWICKVGLRAVAELSSPTTGQHSRDLIPCFRLSTMAFPNHSRTLLFGLQIACASAESYFLGLPKSEFLRMGYNVARDMVEVVEEVSLSSNFGVSRPSQSELFSTTLPEFFPNRSWRDNLADLAMENIAKMRWALNPNRLILGDLSFVRGELPGIRLELSAVEETSPNFGLGAGVQTIPNTLSEYLSKVSSPYVVRGAVLSNKYSEICTESILEELCHTVITVQCRVSPGIEFTFCRAAHQWIDAKKFSPPSILISTTVEDALGRMSEENVRQPFFYTESTEEKVYIQTRVRRSKCLFSGLKAKNLRVAQEERMWISTHGTVSGLHYDSSYSALLQRTGSKRMLFFPPECLEYLGIYPLGHPLHRRSRVDLSRPESKLFQDFWKFGSSQAVEVILEQGDMVVFPPFWAHYTESMALDPKELSISHTIRFM